MSEEHDNDVVNLKEGNSSEDKQAIVSNIKMYLTKDPELRNQIWAWLKTQKCQVSKILT